MNDRFQAYWKANPHLSYHAAYSRFRRGAEPSRNEQLRKFLRLCRTNGIKQIWIRTKPVKTKEPPVVPTGWGIDFAYGVDTNGDCRPMTMANICLQMGWFACINGVIQLTPYAFGGVKRYYKFKGGKNDINER